MKKSLKIISIILIQAFLLLDFSPALAAVVFSEAKRRAAGCLAPRLAISGGSLEMFFREYQEDSWPGAEVLPFVSKRLALKNKKNGEEELVTITTLVRKDLEEAMAVHNTSWTDKIWGPRFVLDEEEAKRMFMANRGGHLVARNENGEIVGVIWCASLFAESIEAINGSFKSVRLNRRNRKQDNIWLHYAVSARKDYLKRGFGAQIAGSLLVSTKALTDNIEGIGNMARGTYSPMSGFGAFKGKCSPTAYLIKHRVKENAADDIGYLDWRYSPIKMTFREFLIKRKVDPEWMQWDDYSAFVKHSGFSLTDFVRESRKSLMCVAANLHLKNGAEVVRIVEGGREGDYESGECAMVILYRGLPGREDESIRNTGAVLNSLMVFGLFGLALKAYTGTLFGGGEQVFGDWPGLVNSAVLLAMDPLSGVSEQRPVFEPKSKPLVPEPPPAEKGKDVDNERQEKYPARQKADKKEEPARKQVLRDRVTISPQAKIMYYSLLIEKAI